MNSSTRRGNTIYAVLYSAIFIIVGIWLLEKHLIKHEPMQTWKYFVFPLLVIVWVGGLLFALKVDDEQLHEFLVKHNLRWVEWMISKNQ